MQGNFNISIPSIPNSIVKFKIQDIKVKGFVGKQVRFREDKSYLARKFINTFDNIKPPTKITEQDNKSQLSTNLSKAFRLKEDNFRLIVDRDIKKLYLQYEKKKSIERDNSEDENKLVRGYSFAKSGMNDSLDYEIKRHGSEVKRQESIIDNNYFNQTQESFEEEEEEDKKIQIQPRVLKQNNNKPSAVFKSEDRWQNDQRILNSKIKLGPGEYIHPKQLKKIMQHRQQANPQKSINIHRIKEMFKDDKNQNISLLYPLNNAKRQQLQKEHYSSMFIPSNQDRFGNPLYPLSLSPSVPGPGSYEFNDTLEQQAKKIIIVEEQRKLLKEWYND